MKIGQPYICPLLFLEYQIEKYTELVAEARTFEEKVWRKRELYNLKQYQKSLYN